MNRLVARILCIFNKNTICLHAPGVTVLHIKKLNAYFQRIFSSVKSVTTYVFYFLSAFVVFSSFDRSFSHPCMFMFTVFTKSQNITSHSTPIRFYFTTGTTSVSIKISR